MYLTTEQTERSPTTEFSFAGLFRHIIIRPWNVMRNRHATKMLLLQSAHHLDDIGLNRADIVDALHLERLGDPTKILEQRRAANYRRRHYREK